MKGNRNVLKALGEKEWLIMLLWFGLVVIACLVEIKNNNYNNFIIFKHVFLHTWKELPLYIPYPAEYNDVNLYGPLFSLVVAPFVPFPDVVGAMLWTITGAAFLLYAIRQLPLTRLQQNMVLLLSAHELMGTSLCFQSNQYIAACILLAFANIVKGKDGLAAFFVVVGTFTKLYGIVGLAFFFFSSNPRRFIGYLLLWGGVLFALPMLISSPRFIIQSYQDWFAALTYKNVKNYNLTGGVVYQNISAMGLIQRVFHLKTISNMAVLLPAVLLFAAQYLRLPWRYNSRFRLYILCSTLLFPVLFSTSSESPTYIIAYLAVCIWYVIQEPGKWVNAMMIFALLLTSFGNSDLFTSWVRRNITIPYALKALPCLVAWLVIIVQVLTKQYLRLPAAAPAPEKDSLKMTPSV